jgi:glycosyltransferase involved in cell wall biosynthesis
LHIVALICARNEELHIARCLRDIVSGGIEAILIDHESKDRTVEIARRYLGHGLLSIEHLAWRGCFSLQEQLRRKKQIISQLSHDWVLHVDADEWLCPAGPGTLLADAIERVDQAGFNCINFDEFVFVPLANEDFSGTDYVRGMTTYYFFAPRQQRLIRAWRRDLGGDNTAHGGHLLEANQIKLYPQNFILRHYIALSQAHAARKYVWRRYDEAELAIGWHFNRIAIKDSDLALQPSSVLRKLDRWDSVNFDLSTPAKMHFWEWGRNDAGKP